MATVEPLSALALAERLREGTGCASAFDLWRAADAESENASLRRTRYRHALIHAGLLFTGKGVPYRRCPMCHCTLGRPPDNERR